MPLPKEVNFVTFDVYGSLIDSDTGVYEAFAKEADESVAELNVGPDGAYYNGNSPIRRAFTRATSAPG